MDIVSDRLRKLVDNSEKYKVSWQPTPSVEEPDLVWVCLSLNVLQSTTERSQRLVLKSTHHQTSPPVLSSHTTVFCPPIGSWTTLMSPLSSTTKLCTISAKRNWTSSDQVTPT